MSFRIHSLFRRQTKVSYLNYGLKLVKTSDTTQRHILSRGIFHNFFLDKRGKRVARYLLMQQVEGPALW